MNQDNGSTLAGGALGLHYLSTVNFSALPSVGEFAKLAVAFALMIVGYFMYRTPKPAPPPVVDAPKA